MVSVLLFGFEHGSPPGGLVARACAVSVFFCRTMSVRSDGRRSTKA